MTLSEAGNQIEEYSHLIGTKHKDSQIDSLVIIPASGDKMGEITGRVLTNRPYGDLLSGFEDFNVIALFDLEKYPNNGALLFENLENCKK